MAQTNQVIVVGEGVCVQQELDSVTFFDKACHMLAQPARKAATGLKPPELERVQLGEGEGLADADVKDQCSS